MPIEFRVGVTVRKTRDEVAKVVFDPSFTPAWRRGVLEVQSLPDAPLKVGSTFEWVVRAFAGGRFELLQIVAMEPGVSQTLRSDIATYTFELSRIAEGTIAQVTGRIAPTGLQRLLGSWATARVRRGWLRDLHQLKRFMESDEYRTWGREDEAAS